MVQESRGFAEGLELLLTGRNFRWEKPRAKVWQEGWRNYTTTIGYR